MTTSESLQKRNFMDGDSFFNNFKSSINFPIHSRDLNSSQQFCNKENINSCLVYLNQELVGHGMPAMFNKPGDFHISYLINSTFELLEKVRNSATARQSLEESKHRALCDLEQLKGEKKKLKSKLESTEKELSLQKNKVDLLTKEVSAKEAKLKTERDEIRSLQAALKSKEFQFKKSLKKDEKEMNRLKERLGNLLTDKNERKAAIRISENLARSEGKRSQWGATAANKDVLRTYEDKHLALLQENKTLREDLKQLYEQLINLNMKLSIPDQSACANEEDHISNVTFNTNKDQDFLTEGCFEMPYSTNGADLTKRVLDEINKIQEKFEESQPFCSRRPPSVNCDESCFETASYKSIGTFNKIRVSPLKSSLNMRPKSAFQTHFVGTRINNSRSSVLSSSCRNHQAGFRSARTTKSKLQEKHVSVSETSSTVNESYNSSSEDCEESVKKPRRLIRSESYTILKDPSTKDLGTLEILEDSISKYLISSNTSYETSQSPREETVKTCDDDDDDDDYI